MKSILVKLGKLFSVRMLAIGLTFLQTIAITQVFGSEVFGLLSFALSISALAVLILSAGLDQVLMRDIARIGENHVAYSERWKHTWKLVKRVVVPFTLFVSLAGAFTVFFTEVAGPYKYTILAAFLLLPVILSRKYLEAICQGTKLIIRSIIGSQLVYPLLMILGAAYVWYFGIEANVLNVSFVYSIAVISSFIASAFLISASLKNIKASGKRPSPDNGRDSFNSESPGQLQLFKSGIHFSLASLGFVLGQNIDVILMGLLSTPEDVGLVRIAARVAEIAGLMRAIIIIQYKPLLAEAHGQKDSYRLQNHALFMLKIFVSTGIPITAFCWVFAEQIMLVFGPEFVDAAWAMRIYVGGVLFTLLMGPSNSILSMTGNESYASRTLFFALCIQIALDLIFIPLFGVNGCAIANFLSLCFLGMRSRYIVSRKVGVESSILVFWKGGTN